MGLIMKGMRSSRLELNSEKTQVICLAYSQRRRQLKEQWKGRKLQVMKEGRNKQRRKKEKFLVLPGAQV